MPEECAVDKSLALTDYQSVESKATCLLRPRPAKNLCGADKRVEQWWRTHRRSASAIVSEWWTNNGCLSDSKSRRDADAHRQIQTSCESVRPLPVMSQIRA